MKISEEMVKLAWNIAVTGRPVGAGDGCGTITVEPPTLANMRRAIEAIAPMIRAAERERIAAALPSIIRSELDWPESEDPDGAVARSLGEIAAAIRDLGDKADD